MIISPSMAIEGCSVTDYLLEVTRVCGCGEKASEDPWRVLGSERRSGIITSSSSCYKLVMTRS